MAEPSRASSPGPARRSGLSSAAISAPGRSELNPASVWKDFATAPPRPARRSGRSLRPYMHHCVGGNTKFWGTVMRLRPRTSRKCNADGVSWRGRSTTIPRGATIAAEAIRGDGEVGSILLKVRAIRIPSPPFLTPPSSAPSSRSCGAGAASVAAATGPSLELHLLQHLQLVSLQDSRKERRGSLRRQARDRDGQRHAVGQRHSTQVDYR